MANKTLRQKKKTCIIESKIEQSHEKAYLMSYAKNKDADQPAQPHSLISIFVVRCLDI